MGSGSLEDHVSIPSCVNPEEIGYQLRNELEATIVSAYQKYLACLIPNEANLKKHHLADWSKALRKLWVRELEWPIASYAPELCFEAICSGVRGGSFNRLLLLLTSLLNCIGPNQPEFVEDVKDCLKHHGAPFMLIQNSQMLWEIVQTGTVLEKNLIEAAFTDAFSANMTPVFLHLQNAGVEMGKLAYGKVADESASALEACLKILTNNPDGQFGECFKLYEKAHPLPTCWKISINQIWGYDNAIPGGRHCEKDNSKHPRATVWDAQYCYGHTCAAVSFLINRSRDQ